jgi:hypothetical protein
MARFARSSFVITALLGAIVSVGCYAPHGPADNPAPGSNDPADVTTVQLQLTTVPTGAQCIQVVVTTSAGTVTKSLTVTAGSSSASLALDRLAVGPATFKASAFDVACTALSGVVASWIADPVMVTIKPGVPTTLALNFRANQKIVATGNFVANIVKAVMGNGSYLLMGDGTYRTAGDGLGTLSQVFTNTHPGITQVAELTATTSSVFCFRKTDNTVWCMGENQTGAVGPGTPIGGFSTTPSQIPLPGPASTVVVGGTLEGFAGGSRAFACAVVGTNLYCWGDNTLGQFGIAPSPPTTTPTLSATSLSTSFDGARLFAGVGYMCAILGGIADNAVACWGANSRGQVGTGTMSTTALPTNVPVNATVDLAVGTYHSCALRADNTVRCWGANESGQLGDGTQTDRLSPTVVAGLTDATQISASQGGSTCARRLNGQISCWGSNGAGLLGDGSGELRTGPQVVPGLAGVSSVALGFVHACAILDDQTLRCWGMNNLGQVGDGTTINRFRPVVAQVQ